MNRKYKLPRPTRRGLPRGGAYSAPLLLNSKGQSFRVRGHGVVLTQEQWRAALISDAKRAVSQGRLKQMKMAHEKLVAEMLASRELEEA